MQTLYQMMPLVLLIGIMYVLLIRPQKKKEKAINAMRSAVKAGDDIITIGGIIGKVTRVKDDSLTIQIGADKTKMEITRWAVSKIVEEGDEAPASRTGRTRSAFAKKQEEPAEKKPRRRLDRESDVEPIIPDPVSETSDVAENVEPSESEDL